MNKKLIYTIIGIAIVFAIAIPQLFWMIFKDSSDIEIPSIEKELVLNFDELDYKLYFKAEAWGLAGNNEQIVLSSNPINQNNRSKKSENYIFYTPEIYYQKIGKDTLVIYVNQSSILEPKSFKSPIEIIIRGLKTASENKFYESNYEKKGLTRFSIF